MKKVLSLVLALAMVFSCFSVAFAAPEDVTNKDQVKAVDALMALGIVEGYGDDTYKPEKVVTRAEMAKLLVEALGYGDLAVDSVAPFSDAKGTWYEGYASVAAGLGITNGYPGGFFKGNNPVTYQEAAIMILRALGYTDQTVNNGTEAYNPTAYTTTASRVGILKNVTFKADGANRGDIAIMVYNALEVETVETNEDGKAEKIVAYQEEKVIAAGKTKVTNVYEILLDRVANREPLTVKPEMLDKDNKEYMGSIVDLAPYMYQDINVYENKDGDVVFVKSVDSNLTEGTFQVPTTNNTNTLYVKDSNDKTVEIDLSNNTSGADIKVFYNGEEISMTESEMEYKKPDPTTENPNPSETVEIDGKHIVPLKDAKVTVVQNDDDEVLGIVATKATFGDKIDRTYRKDAVKLGSIYLPLDGSDVDLTKVTVTGAVEDINDIKEDDVVIVYAAQGCSNNDIADETKLVVVRDTFEGKITKTNTGLNKLYIDGVEHKLSIILGHETTLKIGCDGTFYNDDQGKVFAFDGETASKPADYAIVVAKYAGEVSSNKVRFKPELKLYTKAGEKVTYVVNSGAEYKNDSNVKLGDVIASDEVTFATTGTAVAVNSLIKYKLNDKNEITAITVVAQDVTKLGTTTIPTDSKAFGLAKDAPVFNVNGIDYDLADNNSLPDDITAYYSEKNDDGDYTIIVANNATQVTGTYALITNVENILNEDDEDVLLVTAYVDGEKKEYTTTTNLTAKADIGAANIDSAVVVDITLDGGLLDSLTTPSGIVAVPTGTYVNLAKNGYGLSYEKDDGTAVSITVAGTTGNIAEAEFDEDAVVYIVNSDKEFVAVGERTDVDGALLIAVYDFDCDGKVDCMIVR